MMIESRPKIFTVTVTSLDDKYYGKKRSMSHEMSNTMITS